MVKIVLAIVMVGVIALMGVKAVQAWGYTTKPTMMMSGSGETTTKYNNKYSGQKGQGYYCYPTNHPSVTPLPMPTTPATGTQGISIDPYGTSYSTGYDPTIYYVSPTDAQMKAEAQRINDTVCYPGQHFRLNSQGYYSCW